MRRHYLAKWAPIALLATGSAIAVPAAAANPAALFRVAPAQATPVAPRLAVMYRLKVQLPTGQGLARALIQTGVGKEDAAAAAKLAAGHLGDGAGGCLANVTISRSADGFRLERVALASAAGQTTIERRDGALAIVASDGAARLHLV